MERGPNDLEQQIEDLKKQKAYLQKQCRKAGVAIVGQEVINKNLKKEMISIWNYLRRFMYYMTSLDFIKEFGENGSIYYHNHINFHNIIPNLQYK